MPCSSESCLTRRLIVELVVELEAADALGRDDFRRVLQRQADVGDRDAARALDQIGRQRGPVGVLVAHVGREVAEERARKRVAVLAAVRRVAAAELHAQELVEALVELVVAHPGVLHAHAAECLDGRLVVKEAGDQRRGADEVAGADENRVAAGREALDVRGQEGRATGRGRLDRARGARRGRADRRGARGARGRLQVAVEVVDAEDAQLRGGRAGWGRRGDRLDRRDDRGLGAGKLSVRQLSLLRTRLKADLAVYRRVYDRDLTPEDKAFLRLCGENLLRRPWRAPWVPWKRRRRTRP